MRLRISTFITLILLVNHSFSQVKEYGRKVVDTLSSAKFQGRGYAENGDKNAATYIANEFKKFGLKKFTKKYLQYFPLSVNTFPGAMLLRFDSITLRPGYDYIVDGDSKGIKGKFDLTLVNNKEELFRDPCKYNNRAVVCEPVLWSPKGCTPALFLHPEKNKLTKGISERDRGVSIVYVYDSLILRNAKQVEVHIDQKVQLHRTQNVIGYIEGEVKDTFLVFTAHYDHLGQMGKETFFPGANDNASGTSMMLNIAKYYAAQKTKPKYSLCFMAFSAEEVGLLGSKFYTEHPLFPLSQIKFLLNMDLMGTGEEGITVVNGTLHPKEFNRLVELNKTKSYLKDVKRRGKAQNSDHYYFTEKNVPAFFIYTMGGTRAYHDVYDKSFHCL